MDSKKTCSVTPVASEEECCSIHITLRPSLQVHLRAYMEPESASSIRGLPPSFIAPSTKSFDDKIREKKTQDKEEESV